MQVRKQSRNDRIYEGCLAGMHYPALAAELGVTASRVEQIFVDEVRQRHPKLFATIPRGLGLRKRLIAAVKAHYGAA